MKKILDDIKFDKKKNKSIGTKVLGFVCGNFPALMV